MPWLELREHLDRAHLDVADTWRRRVEMLYESGQLEPLWREVSHPLFIADAWDHPPLAEQALRVVGALAWHTPQVEGVRKSLDDRVRRFGLEALADEIDDE